MPVNPANARYRGTQSAADRVCAAVAALRAGQMVVVADDELRENEGDLIVAAQFVDRDIMAFFLRHGSGIVCAPMSGPVADRLQLPLMVSENTERHGTAFTVSVDHLATGTGISAEDRALTIHSLADPALPAPMLRRPGHVFPLRSRDGGVLKRAGHTEAAVDLVDLAGLQHVAAITELCDDGRPLVGPAVRSFADAHGLPFLAIADLQRYRRQSLSLVRATGDADLPILSGQFHAWCFTSVVDGIEHLALTLGDVASPDYLDGGVLTRVHSECLTGDLFGSQRCDCGAQLRDALEAISAEGTGVLVYLRGHEGRGVGLGHKLRAYQLQQSGLDTVDANVALGLPIDRRDYGVGAAILSALSVRRIRLITNSPQKYSGLAGYDLEIVSRVASPPRITPQNLRYLQTKRDRMGHLLPIDSGIDQDASGLS